MSSTRYQLLSVVQAADQINRTRYFIYDEIEKGRLACHRIGGRICVAQCDLDDYVSRSRIAALGEKKIRKAKETVTP